MHRETNGVNNAVSCYKVAVQFSYITVCQFWWNSCNGSECSTFFAWVTLIKIVNIPFERRAALALSAINWMYSHCTGIHRIRQIRLKIWLEPDLVRYPKLGRIPDLPELEPKSDTTLLAMHYDHYSTIESLQAFSDSAPSGCSWRLQGD